MDFKILATLNSHNFESLFKSVKKKLPKSLFFQLIFFYLNRVFIKLEH